MLGGSCAVELVERWKEIDQATGNQGTCSIFSEKKSTMELDSDKALKDGAPSTVHAEAEVFKEQKKTPLNFSDALVLIDTSNMVDLI